MAAVRRGGVIAVGTARLPKPTAAGVENTVAMRRSETPRLLCTRAPAGARGEYPPAPGAAKFPGEAECCGMRTECAMSHVR